MKFFFFMCMTLFISACSTNDSSNILLCDKLIEMEDQVQRMNLIQLDRGDGIVSEIKSELASTPKIEGMKMKLSKLHYILERMNQIDQKTGEIIFFLEQCKSDLLKNAGENIKKEKNQEASTIVWEKYDQIVDMNRPARLNLSAIIGSIPKVGD